MDGFDAEDFSLRWLYFPNGGSVTSTTSTAFNTGSSILFGTGGYSQFSSALKKLVTPSAQIFVGFRYNYAIDKNGQAYIVNLMGDTGSTLHLRLMVNLTTYTLSLLRNTTVIATSTADSQPLNPGSWYYVEMSATIDSTAGTAVVRVNGNTVISFSGNTRNGGTSTDVDCIALGYSPGYGTAGRSNSFLVDDVYICNSLGSTNNTFLGDVQVQTLLPTGAGTSTQLTPIGSASNYANVNDVPDSDSTYNSSSTAGQRDTYAMGDISGDPDIVFGVQQVTHAFKTTSGTGNLKAAQLSGGVVSYGANNSLGTSNTAYIDIFESNPATGVPYTTTDLNGLEAGGEVA